MWDIPTPELAVALRAQELDIFVFDDHDQNDLQPYLGFTKVRLVPIVHLSSARAASQGNTGSQGCQGRQERHYYNLRRVAHGSRRSG